LDYLLNLPKVNKTFMQASMSLAREEKLELIKAVLEALGRVSIL
jgi:hypothetical protein